MSIKRTVATFVASSMIFLGSVTNLNDRIEDKEEEIDNLKNKLVIEEQLSNSEIAELESIVKKKDKHINQLDSKLEEKIDNYEELEEKNKKLEDKNKELKGKNENLKVENEKLKQKQEEIAKVKVEANQDAKSEQKSSTKPNFNESAKGSDVSSYDSTMIVTAYTAGHESTQKRKGEAGYGQTASGAYVQEGRTLACPQSIPFGTIVEIEGIGQRVCEDRGGAIVEGRLDLYIADLTTAQNFGEQELKVKIIK